MMNHNHRSLVFNANSVDPDQKLHSVASDLGLHFANIHFMEPKHT